MKHVGGLSRYFTGDPLPGNTLQAKLRALGADVEYIMTGKSIVDRQKAQREAERLKESIRIHFWAPEGVSEEERKVYERLAEIIAKVPREDAHKVEAIVRAYMKSAIKGDKHDDKKRKAAP